ncbi:hypothetical protein HYU07_04450 [Candidatus Woesearchaeota archaeon]|nr:hypothetical protein [Candidatus Woesearchaeota archaeon]
MVEPKEFKNMIRSIISQEYRLEFLGNNFDQITMLISDSKAQGIYNWIKSVIERKIQPITIGSKKKYKDWAIGELMTFRYAFNLEGIEYRILFVKVKNSFYIEFHLGDHKYYDKVRKSLEMTKKSY